MTKKIISAGLLLAFAAFCSGVPAAMACAADQSVAASNGMTGYDSSNYDSAHAGIEYFFANDNFGSASNQAWGNNSSGDNVSEFNTGAVSIGSGPVMVSGLFDNTFNVSSLQAPSIDGEDIGISAHNTSTGAESTNEAHSDMDYLLKGKTHNGAFINSTIDEGAITGQNNANYNNTDPGIETGKADIEAMVKNSANRNSVSVGEKAGDPTIEASNDTTGFDSYNKAKASAKQLFFLESDNWAHILNDLDLDAVSGYNYANYNTGFGDVKTGDTSAAAIASSTDINVNDTSVSSPVLTGVFAAENSKTGAESVNKAEVSAYVKAAVDNDNFAKIKNILNSVSKSGYNSANYNTGFGAVESGDAESLVSARNSGINMNLTDISLPGDASVEAGNSVTGAGSFNLAKALLGGSAKVENDNTACIANILTGESSTGGNSADYNTGTGKVESGDAMSQAMVLNQANVNDTSIDIGGSVDLKASNEKTGADSKNISVASSDYKVLVENSNSANIFNNLHSYANSGQNSSSYNTGNADVSTGGVMATFGAMNTANVNTVR